MSEVESVIARAPELIKISASSVKTFDQCPKKYFYNYIQREPRLKWDHLDIGNLAHLTLEIFHGWIIEGKNKSRSLARLMGEAFAKARESFPDMHDNFVAETKDMLIEYLATVSGPGGLKATKSVEEPFVFNITDDIIIRGYIDRVDVLTDGRFHIVDYKTTKNKKYLDEFQLLVYGLLLHDKYPDIKEFKGSYLLLRHGSSYMSYDFTMKDVLKNRDRLIKYANDIRSEEEWVPVPTGLCNYCDYKGICPSQTSW